MAEFKPQEFQGGKIDVFRKISPPKENDIFALKKKKTTFFDIVLKEETDIYFSRKRKRHFAHHWHHRAKQSDGHDIKSIIFTLKIGKLVRSDWSQVYSFKMEGMEDLEWIVLGPKETRLFFSISHRIFFYRCDKTAALNSRFR